MTPTVEKFRQAVAAGSHAEAAALLQACREELEAALNKLPPQSAEAAGLAREAKDLFEWARRMTLAARSRMENGRRTLPRRCPYLATPHPRRTWSVEG
ncbi:MAG: hypothetical protein ABFD86_11920 [Bryobacteraceae bacterium]